MVEDQHIAARAVRQPAGGPYSDQKAHSEMACGEVALMKGERWQGNEGRGLCPGRQPGAAGQRRLILTLTGLRMIRPVQYGPDWRLTRRQAAL